MEEKDKLAFVAKALDCPIENLKPGGFLEELEEWDSLGMVSVMAMLDKHFAVRVQPKEIRGFKTVSDILAKMEEGVAN